MQIENDIKLDFSDVLIRPKRSALSSRKEVDLDRVFTLNDHIWQGVPLMAANMDGVGNFMMFKSLLEYKMMTVITKSHTLDDWLQHRKLVEQNLDYIIISTGTTDADIDKLKEIMAEIPDIRFICLDNANGYSEYFIEYCKQIRDIYPSKIIIAGNVVTREMTEALILNGVNIVKIGIGPGQMCLTREQTGVGYPQLSAIDECADAAHGLGGKIIADGGCSSPGDIAKAYVAGADFVMIGSMLAGYEESGGEIIDNNVLFYGMSSKTAQEKNGDVLKDYRASEGRTVKIPFRGSIHPRIQEILGGLRSCGTYIGADRLKNFDKCGSFIRVNNQLNDYYKNYDTGEK